jgi:putative spermidine/putrescine transport system permease protein
MNASATWVGPGKRRRRKIDYVAVVLGIFTVTTLIFIVAPILVVVAVSFSSESYVNFPIPGVSMQWYWRILEYRPFVDSLIVSMKLALAAAVAGSIISMPAALAIARSQSSLASLMASFLLAPLSIPAIVLGFALLYYLSALSFGVSFLALLTAHTVICVPYISRTVLVVYRGIPPDVEEAAAILGANRWQVLVHVTLPLIRPGIFAGGLFALLISFDNLPISFFFGTSTTSTLPVVMLSYLQNQFDPSIAAISTVQMVIAVALLLVVDRFYGINKLNAA